MAIFKRNLADVLHKNAPREKTAAIILAAGSSTRMGGEISKQFMEIYDIPVLAYTLLAYQSCEEISEIIVAARKEDFDRIAEIRSDYQITKLKSVVSGGSSRQISAQNAFSKISKDIGYVAVADGARCLTTPEEISAVCKAAYANLAASAAQRVVGTVKRATEDGKIAETVDRTNLWEAQTPQAFRVALYATALKKAIADGFSATDDNSMVERLGKPIQLVECSKQNIKITTPEDLRIATAIIAMRVAEVSGQDGPQEEEEGEEEEEVSQE